MLNSLVPFLRLVSHAKATLKECEVSSEANGNFLLFFDFPLIELTMEESEKLSQLRVRGLISPTVRSVMPRTPRS